MTALAPIVHVLGDVADGHRVCARCGERVFAQLPDDHDAHQRAEAWSGEWPAGTRVLVHRDTAAFGCADAVTVTNGPQPVECSAGAVA